LIHDLQVGKFRLSLAEYRVHYLGFERCCGTGLYCPPSFLKKNNENILRQHLSSKETQSYIQSVLLQRVYVMREFVHTR
jgi:hypothetical protein